MTDEITREMFQHSTVVIAGLNDRIEAQAAEIERLREALAKVILVRQHTLGLRHIIQRMQRISRAALEGKQ